MIQQVFLTWSNWKWSKEYRPFGPAENHLDLQSKVQVIWSKKYRALNKATAKCVGKNAIGKQMSEVKMSEATRKNVIDNNAIGKKCYIYIYTFIRQN